MSVFAPGIRVSVRAHGAILARKVREYFKDAEHRTDFEKWFEKKYGKKYEWKGTDT